MTEKQKMVITDSIEYYGSDYQSTVAMEEASELIQAVSKIKRYGLSEERKNHLTEEMADVLICIALLQKMYKVSDDELDKMLEEKIERLKNRIAR